MQCRSDCSSKGRGGIVHRDDNVNEYTSSGRPHDQGDMDREFTVYTLGITLELPAFLLLSPDMLVNDRILQKTD